MPSLNPARIREEFFYQPNGEPGFTFTAIARANAVEINKGFVGPRDQGWASPAEHFGRRLAKLCEHDRAVRSARTNENR
jgi:hypothetical protein